VVLSPPALLSSFPHSPAFFCFQSLVFPPCPATKEKHRHSVPHISPLLWAPMAGICHDLFSRLVFFPPLVPPQPPSFFWIHSARSMLCNSYTSTVPPSRRHWFGPVVKFSGRLEFTDGFTYVPARDFFFLKNGFFPRLRLWTFPLTLFKGRPVFCLQPLPPAPYFLPAFTPPIV